jgi:hypothetical protein
VSAIRWTSKKEVIDVPASAEEIAAATAAAIDAQLKVRAHRALRKRVNESLDLEEAQLIQRLNNTLDCVQGRRRAVAALVGYDLETGEAVLVRPDTKEEVGRRPMNDADRRIAQAMPPDA